MNQWVFPGLTKNTLTIKDFAKDRSEDCVNVVSEYFQIKPSMLKSKSRLREIVLPRQLCMWILLRGFKIDGSSKIGKVFKRDHATVLHACKTVEDLIETDESFRADVLRVINRLSLNYQLKNNKIYFG